MKLRPALRGAALLVLLPVASAAVASLSGPGAVERVVGSGWFIALSAAGGLLSLAAAVLSLARRRPLIAESLLHFGIVAGLVGVLVNQRAAHSGYLFLEAGAGGKNFVLDRSLRRIEPLPFSAQLEALNEVQSKGFRPAPAASVRIDGRPGLLTYNRPARHSGRSLVLVRTVEPGFPHEYELTADGQPYLLLHNQQAVLADGSRLWSFGHDPARRMLGILVGPNEVWLAEGDSAVVGSTRLRLDAASFARNAGAIFVVYDSRLRPAIFGGFGLALLGVALLAVRRRES